MVEGVKCIGWIRNWLSNGRKDTDDGNYDFLWNLCKKKWDRKIEVPTAVQLS